MNKRGFYLSLEFAKAERDQMREKAYKKNIAKLLNNYIHSEIIRGLQRPRKGYSTESKPQYKERNHSKWVVNQNPDKPIIEVWWELNIDDISTYIELPDNAVVHVIPKPGDEKWIMHKDEQNNLVMGTVETPGKKYDLNGEIK
jgi:hypothetical protein